MRGDSLRDLYAKSLALVGLGVLAGVGALVDYWPTQSALPPVDAQRSLPAAASARPVADTAIDILLPVRPAPPPRVAPVARAASLVIPDVSAVPVAWTTPSAVLAGVGYAPVTLDRRVAPAPPVESFVAPPVAAVHAAPVPLSEPDFGDLPPRFLSAAGQTNAPEDEGGFFSGATDFAKKAGSSILSTGSKAGASILDGLNLVGRGLKKLKFF